MLKNTREFLDNIIILFKSHLANAISLLGTIPVFILIESQSYPFFPLIASTNILADDLDGIIARKLGTNSDFGKYIDILCDAVSHSILMIVIARNHGLMTKLITPIIFISIIIRLASSSSLKTGKLNGTTTNEYVVSMQLIVALESLWGHNLEILLIILTVISIVTLNIKSKIKTFRRSMGNAMLLSFDILLILASFLPELALLLLSFHIFFFITSFTSIIYMKLL